MSSNNLVQSFPPIQSPMTDKNGAVTPIWSKWLSSLYIQTGGSTSSSVTELQSDIVTLQANVGVLNSEVSTLSTLYSATYRLSVDTAITINTPILFDQRVEDTHNAFNTGTGLFTAPIAGLYLVMSTLQVATAATDGIYVQTSSRVPFLFSLLSNGQIGSGQALVRLALHDTLAIQDSASNTFTGGSDSSYFSIVRVGA